MRFRVLSEVRAEERPVNRETSLRKSVSFVAVPEGAPPLLCLCRVAGVPLGGEVKTER